MAKISVPVSSRQQAILVVEKVYNADPSGGLREGGTHFSGSVLTAQYNESEETVEIYSGYYMKESLQEMFT
jgi:hypothetical protein